MLRKKLKLSSLEDQDGTNLLELAVSHEPEPQPNLIFTTPRNDDIRCMNNNLSRTADIPVSDYSIPIKMIHIQQKLNQLLEHINFLQDPIQYIYNPTIYAKQSMEEYLKLYCNNEKKILFIGMNPGPWGMCQTGIPFGEVKMVRDWLHINLPVGKPPNECSKRKVEGFQCPMKEISGDRFWNFIKKLCGTPQKFFSNCFVYNYCPIALMKENGTNLTPAEIKISLLKSSLQEVCDNALEEVIATLKPEIIIGIGRYAEERARKIVKRIPQDSGGFRGGAKVVSPPPRDYNSFCDNIIFAGLSENYYCVTLESPPPQKIPGSAPATRYKNIVYGSS